MLARPEPTVPMPRCKPTLRASGPLTQRQSAIAWNGWPENAMAMLGLPELEEAAIGLPCWSLGSGQDRTWRRFHLLSSLAPAASSQGWGKISNENPSISPETCSICIRGLIGAQETITLRRPAFRSGHPIMRTYLCQCTCYPPQTLPVLWLWSRFLSA